MSERRTNSSLENAENDVAGRLTESQRGRLNRLKRIDNKPFESPRGRRQGNPGYGRENGMPFVSQRGRGRRHVIPLEAQAADPDTASGSSYENIYDVDACSAIFDPQQEHFMHDTQPPSGWSNAELDHTDRKPFESTRGSRQDSPGLGRQNGMPFVSQRGRVTQRRSEYAVPSAPSYETIHGHLPNNDRWC